MKDEAPYTNREINEFFRDVKESLVRIESGVIKTNGRVNKLENWRYLISGGMIVITLFVIPMVVYIFTNDKTEVPKEKELIPYYQSLVQK